jgi:putative peptidoglycan lipid II flippase
VRAVSQPSAPVAVTPVAPARRPARSGGAAARVASGILLSRLAGFVRQRAFAYYLGTSAAADAWTAAFRIPNVMQNLLGEGVLSASFIPVYASLRARGNDKEARAVAGAVAGLLGLVTALFALVGIVATPWLLNVIAPGFEGATRDLAIHLVRIFFPGVSLLVLSAFCLGVLNSHHRFFLSYAAPVVSSLAVIAALVFGGRQHLGQFPLAVVAAWGAVAGAALQMIVQVPTVLRLLGPGTRVSLGRGNAQVREVVRNFLPVVAGRGVVQLSAYVDAAIASEIGLGTVAAFAYAQLIFTLPVSLFGMAISAASLPSMSAAQGGAEPGVAQEKLRAQLASGLRAIAFPVVASVVMFLVFGDVLCAALFQNGRFGPSEVRYVWLILAGSTVGLLAATMGRLYSSAFYALRDTRTPLRFAILRVTLTLVLGLVCGLWLPRLWGVPRYGAAGLTASAGVAGWIEFFLLRRALARRVGAAGVPAGLLARLWASAAAAAGLAYGVRLLLARAPLPLSRWALHPIPLAVAVLGTYGAAYFGATLLLGVPEARALLRRVLKRRAG